MRSVWVETLAALVADDSGQTMAEYGLVAAVLGVMMIGAVGMITTESGGLLNGTANGLVGIAQNPP